MPRSANLEAPRRFGAVLLFLLFLSTAFCEAEKIHSVVLTGRHSLNEKEQALVITSLKDKTFSPAQIQKVADFIRRKCMADYYPLTKVKWKTLPVSSSPAKVYVLFSVERGPRGRVREIRVEGNTIFEEEELLELLKVMPRNSWWPGLLQQDALDPDDLVGDRNRLLLHYLEAGYAAAEVEPAVIERYPDGSGFRVTWRVANEGAVHGVGSISFDADVLPPEEVVEQLVVLQPDERYNAIRVNAVRAGLLRYFVENGHAFARVEVSEERIPSENRVNIEFRVRAGRRPVLREIHIDGQDRTKPEIVRNEISLRKGELYDPVKLEASKLRLAQLPMFSKVDLAVEGVPEAGVFDLRVRVRERKTGRVEGGVVYGDAEGAALQFNLSERNLDLVPPFRGGGYEAGVSATVGNEIIRGELRLTDPRVGESDWSIYGSVFYEDSEAISDYYDQESFGGQIVGAHPLSPGWTGSIGYSVLFAELYNIDRDALPDLNEVDENMQLTSLVGFLAYDNTDEAFRPSRGVRGRGGIQVGSELLGGNVDAVQVTLKLGGFVNPLGDHVIGLRVGFDSVNPFGDTAQTPQALKQYLGGGQTLRGFEYRSVSPLDERGRTLGGDTRWWASAEYLFPIVRDRLDLALFYDIGDVSSDAFSFSGEGPVSNVGIGFSVRADNFPVRFNLAMPLETYEGDRTNETGNLYISFTVGYQY
jgi:outer membrane protein insertion porin family